MKEIEGRRREFDREVFKDSPHLKRLVNAKLKGVRCRAVDQHRHRRRVGQRRAESIHVHRRCHGSQCGGGRRLERLGTQLGGRAEARQIVWLDVNEPHAGSDRGVNDR